jgi:pentapeptide repeat protein
MGQSPEKVWTEGEFAGRPRRYQSGWVYEQTELVRFAPSGPNPDYFFNYCARINAGRYRPLGLFPVQVDLRRAELSEADLRRANLRGADLRGADLRWALIDPVQLKLARIDE